MDVSYPNPAAPYPNPFYPPEAQEKRWCWAVAGLHARSGCSGAARTHSFTVPIMAKGEQANIEFFLGSLKTNLPSYSKRNPSDVPEDLGQCCLGWKSRSSLQSVTTEEYYKNPSLQVKQVFNLWQEMTVLCRYMQPLLGWMVAATLAYRALEEFRTPEAPNPSLEWNCRVIKQRECNYPNCNLASTMDLTPLFLGGKKISTVFEVQNLINYLRKRILFLKENS